MKWHCKNVLEGIQYNGRPACYSNHLQKLLTLYLPSIAMEISNLSRIHLKQCCPTLYQESPQMWQQGLCCRHISKILIFLSNQNVYFTILACYFSQPSIEITISLRITLNMMTVFLNILKYNSEEIVLFATCGEWRQGQTTLI